MADTSAELSAMYEVADLQSLFTVCALALESVDDLREDIRYRKTQDIKHVLEWGARKSDALCERVEKLEGRVAEVEGSDYG